MYSGLDKNTDLHTMLDSVYYVLFNHTDSLLHHKIINDSTLIFLRDTHPSGYWPTRPRSMFIFLKYIGPGHGDAGTKSLDSWGGLYGDWSFEVFYAWFTKGSSLGLMSHEINTFPVDANDVPTNIAICLHNDPITVQEPQEVDYETFAYCFSRLPGVMYPDSGKNFWDGSKTKLQIPTKAYLIDKESLDMDPEVLNPSY